jgi:hypothetical protein
MRIQECFLAEQVAVRDGVFDVQGGFPEWLKFPQLPCMATLAVGVVVEFDPDELGKTYDLHVELIKTGADSPLVSMKVPAGRNEESIMPGAPLYEPMAIPLHVVFTETGSHELHVWVGDGKREEAWFAVSVPDGQQGELAP